MLPRRHTLIQARLGRRTQGHVRILVATEATDIPHPGDLGPARARCRRRVHRLGGCIRRALGRICRERRIRFLHRDEATTCRQRAPPRKIAPERSSPGSPARSTGRTTLTTSAPRDHRTCGARARGRARTTSPGRRGPGGSFTPVTAPDATSDPEIPAEGFRQHRFTPPPGATTILLVRHGESAPAHPDRPFALKDGHGDPPLDPYGERQAELLAERLQHENDLRHLRHLAATHPPDRGAARGAARPDAASKSPNSARCSSANGKRASSASGPRSATRSSNRSSCRSAGT